jgi:membrane protease subunit HflK
MAWNEPGGPPDNDPWGSRKNSNRTPPDFDETLRKMRERFSGDFFGRGPNPLVIFLIIVIALAAWIVGTGFYIVDAGQRGVVTQFGRFVYETGPGPHLHLPFPIEAVDIVNVDEFRTIQTRSQMLTADENILDIELAVQYNISNAQAYLFNVRNPDLTVQQVAESAIREAIGRNRMDYTLYTNRSDVIAQTRDFLQARLDDYATGLRVLSVNLQQAQPPEQVQAAFDDAIKAREDKQRFINEAEAYSNDVVPRARGDAQRLLEEAEAYRAQVVNISQGETSRFLSLLQEYRNNPEVFRARLYLTSMESVFSNSKNVFVDVSSTSTLLLPLSAVDNPSAVTQAAAAMQSNRLNSSTIPSSNDASSNNVLRDPRNLRAREAP